MLCNICMARQKNHHTNKVLFYYILKSRCSNFMLLILLIYTQIFTTYDKQRWILSYLWQAWRRLYVKRQCMWQTTWIILMTLASSKAQLLASDPGTSQRTTLLVSSCRQQSVSPSLTASISWPCPVFLSSVDYEGLLKKLSVCELFQSYSCVHKKNEKLSACLASRQTIPICPCCVCWFSSALSVLKCRASDQEMRPFLKENLPKRFHYANNKRIERGHLYMKSGWQAAL